MFLKDNLMAILSLILTIIGVLVGVAFLTLLERKALGYIQLRKGPNKTGILGILQPFSDAIKLFSKEQTSPLKSNMAPYYISPIIALFLSLMIWSISPNEFSFINFSLGMIFFLACASMSVYTLMTAGWSSNSNYALLGSLRAVSQTISYEVSLALILMFIMMLMSSFNLSNLTKNQEMVWFLFINIPLALTWFSSSLAETNRTPFDFAEGESELVSGFNVEYSSGGFALIFLAEYASILFMSMLFVTLFMGGVSPTTLFPIKTVLISFIFIWARGTLPRLRYDKLMYLSWKSYLPMILNFLLMAIGLVSFSSLP
uniref:NADH dehydrogenase subunit 1 n=1 Tax=Haplodiplatys aotouensis TaxID=2962943 RepID=UPI002114CC37|nr:NADH dehydrogenase subunit 1 [Haplodiplatys aotouensis]UTI38889.1 NADH dehydrogenase subunit 1 [Haplodiplatys aotouensis]UTI38902.1 NADH dehydrogenase subunit 1 [Haplodiplatys aotouensis]